VGNVECAGFARHVRMKQNLQQEIAKFLGQILRLAIFDGIKNFVGFFDEVCPECEMGLFPVPGAAAEGAQARLDAHQILEEIPGAFRLERRGNNFAFRNLSARRL
jgi:hypothetical protein